MNQPKTRRPTSHDVAQLAGVSQPTVSIVFSGRAREVGISRATEDKVMAAARSLSYVPNKLMRSIRNGRSGILGVYGPGRMWSMRHSYWSEVLAALHEGANLLEQELLFFAPQEGRSIEDTLNRILSGLVDGVIVQPGTDNAILDRLIEAKIPIVLVGDPYKEIPSNTIDNVAGAEMLVRHLQAQGHRRFVYLRVEDPELTRPFPQLAAELRPNAYDQTLREFGLNPAENPQIHINWDIASTLDRVLETNATAVVCHNDEWAYPFAREAELRGLKLPDDLALVGFDGIPVPFARQLVTTIKSPILEVGRAAIAKLKAIVEGQSVEPLTVLPVEFVKGDTT